MLNYKLVFSKVGIQFIDLKHVNFLYVQIHVPVPKIFVITYSDLPNQQAGLNT